MADMPEPRFNVDLSMRVFGMDSDGRPFSQMAHALNIGDQGAKLSGLEKRLTPGDTIGMQFGGKKTRCQVMSVVDTGQVQKIEVEVKLAQGQSCPWVQEVAIEKAKPAAPGPAAKPGSAEKRKFRRHRMPFPIEIQDEEAAGMRMSTNTADVCGNGCYVETRLPLPINRNLIVAFWLNSKRVHTPAIVRTCDGGVGMGIEFTGLDEAAQIQLQEHIETMATDSSPLTNARGA